MTEKQFEYLKQFESNFFTSINHNYSTNVQSSDLDKMIKIYEEVTGSKVYMCKYCTSDVLNFLKRIGKLYFDKKEQVGKEQELTTNDLQKAVAKIERKNNKNKKK